MINEAVCSSFTDVGGEGGRTELSSNYTPMGNDVFKIIGHHTCLENNNQ